MDDWNKEFYHHGAAFATTQPSASAGQLTFGGGVSGVGVLSGQAKVYLVFYGTQWGTQGTDSNGKSDVLRRLLRRRGGSAEHVQGHRHEQRIVVGGSDQWCDGPNVAQRRDHLPIERQLRSLPAKHLCRCLVRQLGGFAGFGHCGPAWQ